jgi:hypothetical protein
MKDLKVGGIEIFQIQEIMIFLNLKCHHFFHF